MVEVTDVDAGYDDWLDAIEAGEAYYLDCENGHGSLPPRRVCPHCGTDAIEGVPMPEPGTVETFTVVHVATPQLADDVPYVSAIARFGSVRVTGFLRDVPPDEAAVGRTVSLSVDTTATTGERAVVLRPA